jgi:hypothetical protein
MATNQVIAYYWPGPLDQNHQPAEDQHQELADAHAPHRRRRGRLPAHARPHLPVFEDAVGVLGEHPGPWFSEVAVGTPVAKRTQVRKPAGVA